FVSLAAATLAAVGDAAQRWGWLAPVDAAFRWLDGFAQNFSTEMIGAAITFILLEILLAGRREKEAEQREKERLILQMGSPFNEMAIEAVRQLRVRGWLTDGSLQGAKLIRANLQEADLIDANLQGASLMGANLQGARLWDADLQEAVLSDANLQKARAHDANLQRADLTKANLRRATPECANLQGADLTGAELRRAHLWKANLQRAVLDGANLRGAWSLWLQDLRQAASVEGTILPDSTQLPDNRSFHKGATSNAEALLSAGPTEPIRGQIHDNGFQTW